MRPPPLPHQIVVLQRILDAVAGADTEGAPPVVVFGLDGTLYDIRPRTLQILLEYGEAVRDEFPEVTDALTHLSVEQVQHLLSDTLRACGLTRADVVRDVTNFWRERFFSDEYLAYDVPADGAVEYVYGCHDAGATVVYLTTRDVPAMLLGTVAGLRDHGFPVAVPGVELVLKPDATMGDEAFLRSYMPSLTRSGRIVGFFDSDPTGCNLARQLFAGAHVALLETTMTPPSPDPDPGVDLVTDFRSI